MICTFYSYKGGVGRSMALANVADILSRRGLRVLMIDFDLEAPGLEQFFYRGTEGEQRDAIRRQTGLLDLLLAYKEAMSVAGGAAGFRDVERYIAAIYPRRPGGGRLDLMPAGQRLSPEQLARYALSLRSFDWQDFYFNWEGDLFFEWLRRALVPERYDLVLVDSRTGVTEMGGICGYQLADTIVMMCGANHQNVDGTSSMLEDFRSQQAAGLRRGRALEIVVVPARVEQKSDELLEAFYLRFGQRFAALLPQPLKALGLTFRDLAIPYDPLFAFEERVARGQEESAARQHLASVFGTLADVIAVLAPATAVADTALAHAAKDAAARLGAALSQGQTGATVPAPESVAAHYDETKRFADFDVMLDASRGDSSYVEQLRTLLTAQGLRVYLGTTDMTPGADWRLQTDEALAQSRMLAVALGKAPLAAHRLELVEKALQAQAAGRDIRIVPMLLPGYLDNQPLEPILRDLRALDLRAGVQPNLLERLLGSLRTSGGAAGVQTPHEQKQTSEPTAQAGTQTAALVETELRCPYVGATPASEHQADVFFGRDQEIQALLRCVEQHEVTILLGPSACGKTSLVQAGLLPALRRAHPDWEPWLASAEAWPHAPAGNFLAIFDHLPGRQPDAALRPLFVARLAELEQAGARILVCLRSEQYPEWSSLFLASSLGEAQRYELRVPVGNALRQIIERPADAAGLAFEPGLVDRLVSRAQDEPGVLPFLQISLQRLWEQRRNGWLTNAAYDAFGGIRGVVAEAANRHFDTLQQADQEKMRRILLRLVKLTVGSTRAGMARVPYAKLESAGSQPGPLSVASSPLARTHEHLLAELIDARLLVTDLEQQEPVVELAHETLVRDWPRLQLWLEQEQDFLTWQARLATELDSWKASGRHADQLLRGAALEDARRMRAGHELTLDEIAYIDASAAQQARIAQEVERSRKRRLLVLSSALSVFLLLSAIAGAGWVQTGSKSRTLQTRNALLEQQQQDLAAAKNRAEAEQARALAQLQALQNTLNQALVAAGATPPGILPAGAATAASAPADAASAAPEPSEVVSNLNRAVRQVEQAVESQADYSAARVSEITRQQEVLRGALTKQ